MIHILKSLFGRSGEESVGSKDSHKDPVCGMQVKDVSLGADYQGKTYYFCSEHCKEQFVARPANFVD